MKNQNQFACYWKSLFLVLLFTVALAAPGFAGVVLNQTKDEAGKDRIVVENDFFKLDIAPAYGGMGARFVYKQTGNQWVLPDPDGTDLTGVFGDHLLQPPGGFGSWPGECMAASYDCQVLKNTPEEAVIKLWYRTKEGGPMPEVTGLLLEKELTIKAALPYIICRIKVVNDSKQVKTPQYWMQHCRVRFGKTKDKNYYYRPSARGIRVAFWKSVWPTKIVKGEEYIRDESAGWMGAVSPKDREGLICLMDYNCLDRLYNCIIANTVEWFYDRLSLKPGASWATEIIFRPVFGFTAFSYASANIICDTRPELTGTGVKITQSISAMGAVVSDPVVCRVQLLSYPERKELAVQTVTFERLGLEPESKELTFAKIAPDRLLVIGVEIDARKFKESYETYYDTAAKEKAYYDLTGYEMKPPPKRDASSVLP